jgi:beta-exotoxin I transport system ATP-binding protein
MTVAIRTERLTKYYGSVVGLEDVSLEILEGEVFGFLGPNGAGKTTTIRMLLDLVRPSSGAAWIRGLHCRTQGVEARRYVGYLPGELAIYPELNGGAYLAYLAKVGGQSIPAQSLDHLLRRFDVSDVDLRRPMREYSHGMKRKLGIIQALAPGPLVLILDEPTNGLDPLMIEAFAETLHELKQSRGTTVFLSSHVLSEVEKTCDRVGLVRHGKLAALQSLSEIRASVPRRVTVTFTQPVAEPPAIEGVSVVTCAATSWLVDVRGPLGRFIERLAGLPVDDIRVDPFSLEDYVLRFYSDPSQDPAAMPSRRH